MFDFYTIIVQAHACMLNVLIYISGLKQYFYVARYGVLLVLFGESLRKASMITASTNFNHYVQFVKRPGHQLVTKGVYSWCRHPSYVGWFYWSIGTQVNYPNFCRKVTSFSWLKRELHERLLCTCVIYFSLC